MPASEGTFYARDRDAWRRWLERNHEGSAGVWLIFYKKASGKRSVPYDEAVEEALCFGWIDGKVQQVDEDAYRQRFSRRRPKSTWAASNKERVARLIREGRMSPAGLAAIQRAKLDGSWTSLDAVDAMTMPDDLGRALAHNKRAARNFESFSPSARKAFLYWIGTAKRPETRAKRIAETVRRAAANQKLG